jgi:hypothetical protein
MKKLATAIAVVAITPSLNSLTFQGMSARIMLTANDPHTVAAHFTQTDPARPGVVDITLNCTPTPSERRRH